VSGGAPQDAARADSRTAQSNRSALLVGVPRCGSPMEVAAWRPSVGRRDWVLRDSHPLGHRYARIVNSSSTRQSAPLVRGAAIASRAAVEALQSEAPCRISSRQVPARDLLLSGGRRLSMIRPIVVLTLRLSSDREYRPAPHPDLRDLRQRSVARCTQPSGARTTPIQPRLPASTRSSARPRRGRCSRR